MYCSAVLLEISVLKITFLFCFCTLSAYLLTFLVLHQQFYMIYHIFEDKRLKCKKIHALVTRGRVAFFGEIFSVDASSPLKRANATLRVPTL